MPIAVSGSSSSCSLCTAQVVISDGGSQAHAGASAMPACENVVLVPYDSTASALCEDAVAAPPGETVPAPARQPGAGTGSPG
jgi:hypothetical protein